MIWVSAEPYVRRSSAVLASYYFNSDNSFGSVCAASYILSLSALPISDFKLTGNLINRPSAFSIIKVVRG